MTNEIYSATGCARCKITKKYMKDNGIDYAEFDFKAEGKDAFAQFYRTHRKNIFRDKDGVEFPVFYDGNNIRQGVSVIIGYLIAGDKLDGFISRSLLHGEWIDGFDISGGDVQAADNLYEVLSCLKSSGLKVQVTTNGKNAAVLETIVNRNLCDRIIMEVKGPASLYQKLCGQEIIEDELKKSINIAGTVSEHAFYSVVAPLERENGDIEFLTTEEISATAELIEAATASKKQPYELRLFDSKESNDIRFQSMEPMAPSTMFKYRTAARRYQVMTEIEK